MRGIVFLMLLVVLCVPFCLSPTPCRAVGVDEPNCYPHRTEAAKHAPRKRRVSAVYKAAVNWLKEVIGSLTARKSRTSLDWERRPARQDDAIVPTVRLDLKKERVVVGFKMRF